jgi:hypothetical protein
LQASEVRSMIKEDEGRREERVESERDREREKATHKLSLVRGPRRRQRSVVFALQRRLRACV